MLDYRLEELFSKMELHGSLRISGSWLLDGYVYNLPFGVIVDANAVYYMHGGVWLTDFNEFKYRITKMTEGKIYNPSKKK